MNVQQKTQMLHWDPIFQTFVIFFVSIAGFFVFVYFYSFSLSLATHYHMNSDEAFLPSKTGGISSSIYHKILKFRINIISGLVLQVIGHHSCYKKNQPRIKQKVNKTFEKRPEKGEECFGFQLSKCFLYQQSVHQYIFKQWSRYNHCQIMLH